MPANRHNIIDLWNAFYKALAGNDLEETKRIGDDLFSTLADNAGGEGTGTAAPKSGVRTSRIPQQMVNYTAGSVQSPLNVAATTKGQGIAEGKQTSFDADSGHNLRVARVAAGEAVIPNSAVCVLNNVAYLSDGTNTARPCHGVCVRGSGNAGEILWRPGGTAVVRVKRGTSVSAYGTLYQSITPGVLTNDSAEGGLAYVQAVGHFKQWVAPRAGEAAPELAEVNITIGMAGSGAGGSATWGGITGTLSDQTDLQAALDGKEDTLTYGTPGQVMATNATVNGYEWTDAYGAAYIDGGSFTDTYTSSPFDIDGGTL